MEIEPKKDISNLLLNIAWLSVLLGIFMELILLAVAAGFNVQIKAPVVITDSVSKVSWATIVCIGLGIGAAASKMKHKFMGLAGIIAAPIAFHLAKFLQETAALILALTLPALSGPSPILVAVIKGIQYGTLGYLLDGLSMNNDFNIYKHIFSGFITGIVFGGILIYLSVTMSLSPVPIATIVSKSLNEIIFPIGCSLVLYYVQKPRKT